MGKMVEAETVAAQKSTGSAHSKRNEKVVKYVSYYDLKSWITFEKVYRSETGIWEKFLEEIGFPYVFLKGIES
jgi:hypothetical protein